MAKSKSLKNFEQRMKAIPEAVREAVLPAIMRSAEELADRMRHLVPVDEGDLKASITVTGPGESTPAHSQPGGSHVVGPLSASVTAGNKEVRYAHLVEFGTAHGRRAKPYFWVSYRLGKKRIIGRIKRAVSKAVRDKWRTA